MDPSTRALSLSGKVQGSQEMRLNSILLLKARARGDVFLSVFIWPWHGRDKCLPVQHRHSAGVDAVSSCLSVWCLVLCSCTLSAGVCACFCTRLLPFYRHTHSVALHCMASTLHWKQSFIQSNKVWVGVWNMVRHAALCNTWWWVRCTMHRKYCIQKNSIYGKSVEIHLCFLTGVYATP